MGKVESTSRSQKDLQAQQVTLLHALARLTQIKSTNREGQNLLLKIAEAGLEALRPSATICMHIYQPDLNLLRVAEVAGKNQQFRHAALKPGEGASGQAYVQRKTVYIENYTEWAGRVAEFNDSQPHVLALPLIVSDTIFGVITPSDDAPFDPDDIRLWEMFAAHAALVLGHARFTNLSREINQRTRDVFHLSRVKSAPLVAIQEILRQFLTQADDILDFDYAVFAAHRENRLVYVASIGIDGVEHDLTAYLNNGGLTNLKDQVAQNGSGDNLAGFWQSVLPEGSVVGDALATSLDTSTLPHGLVDSATIAFGTTEANVFEPQHHRIVQALAEQTKSILRLAALYQAEHLDRTRKDVLLEIARTLVTSGDQLEILKDILERMGTVLHYATGSIALFKNGKVSQYIPSSSFKEYNPNKEPEDVRDFLQDSVLVKRIQQTKQAIILPTVLDVPDWKDASYNSYIRSWMGIPLTVNQECLGVMMLDGEYAEAYTQDDLELAQAIGAHVSVVLNNLRLYEIERNAKNQAEILREVAASLNASLSLDKVLERIMASAARLIPYTTSSIAVFKPDGSVVTKEIYLSDKTTEVSSSAYWSLDDLPDKLRILREQEQPTVFELSTGGSWFGLPLIMSGVVTGVFYFENTSPSKYSDEQVQLSQVLAEHAVTAIRNANRYEAELEVQRQLSAMLDMANTVSATLDLDTVVQRIMELAAGIIPFTTSCARLYVEEDVVIRLFGVDRMNEKELRHAYAERDQSFPLVEKMFESGRPLIVNDTATEPDWKGLKYFGDVRSWMGVPLLSEGRRVGTLTFDSRLANTYTPEHAKAAEAIASQAVLAIRNAQLFYRTEEALEEVESLFDISNALINANTEEDLLRIATKRANQHSECVAMLFHVTQANATQAQIRAAVQVGSHEEVIVPKIGEVTVLDLSILQALHTATGSEPRKPLFLDANTLMKAPDFDPSMLELLHLKEDQSKLFLPLYAQQRWVGFMSLVWPKPHELSKQELRFYTVVAPQLAAILENRMLLQQTADALDFSQSLYAASHALINTQTEQELLQALLNSSSLSMVENAQLIEVNYRNKVVYGRVVARVANRPAQKPAILHQEFLLDEYVHTKNIAAGDYDIKVIHDIDRDNRPELAASRKRMRKFGDKALILLPLLSRGSQLVGILAFSGSTAHAMSDEQAHFLQVLMPQIAAIIEARKLLKQTREAQLRFEDIALNTSDGVWETNGAQIIYMSPKLAESLGYRPEETLQKPFWQIVREIFSKKDAQRLFETVRSQRRIFEQEFLLKHKDGQKTYYLMSAMPVFNDRGDLSGYRGVLKDVSEKKQAEQRERVAFEVGQHLTSVLSMDDLFAAMIEEMSLILGYPSVFIFMYEPQDQRLYPYYQPTSGQVIMPSDYQVVADALEIKLPIIDSQTAHGTQAAFPLMRGDRLLGVLLVQVEEQGRFTEQEVRVVQNLSAQISVAMENARLYRELQIQAEHLEELVGQRTGEIIEERERLSAIVQNAGEAIVFSRVDGIVELANPAFEAVTGYAVNENLGRQILVRDMLRYLSPQADVKNMLRTIREGNNWRGELRMLRPDGSEFDAGFTVAPVLNSMGAVIRYVTVLHDVSAQKEVDRMRQKFVANVSHELRTPLANLKLYTTLVRSGTEEKRERYLTTMGEQISRLERIVEDLLDISSIDRGMTTVNIKRIDLNRLVDNVLRSHRLRASERGMEIRVLKSSTLPQVLADQERIMQVVTNLLTNAINYSQEGDEIRVQTRGTRQDGKLFAALVVSDTGMGISPDDVPFIFNRFFRAETSKVMGVPGTGLGLSIVKEIVEQHNGEIFVSSFPNKGTTFTILLPAVEPAS